MNYLKHGSGSSSVPGTLNQLVFVIAQSLALSFLARAKMGAILSELAVWADMPFTTLNVRSFSEVDQH